jgi:hypothetical protein
MCRSVVASRRVCGVDARRIITGVSRVAYPTTAAEHRAQSVIMYVLENRC